MKLIKGLKVWWNDPDDGLCSGYKTITDIKEETVILDHGTEVFFDEISELDS